MQIESRFQSFFSFPLAHCARLLRERLVFLDRLAMCSCIYQYSLDVDGGLGGRVVGVRMSLRSAHVFPTHGTLCTVFPNAPMYQVHRRA